MNWVNLILSLVLNSLCAYYFIKNINLKNFTLLQKLSYIILLCILYYYNLNNFDGIYRLIFSILTVFILTHKILLKDDFNSAFFSSFMYLFFSFLSELFFSFILTMFFNFSLTEYNKFDYALLSFTVFNFVFNYIIINIKIIKNLLISLKNKLFLRKSDKIYIMIVIILLILVNTNNKIMLGKNIYYYINIIIFILILLTIIIFIINKIQKEAIEKDYKEMMEYVVKYEQIINEQGKKNHEFNNQLMVLSGYIDNKKKLKEYLSSIIDEHKGGKNYMIEQLSYFPDGGIKGIIYHKLSKMDEYGIKPYLYVDKNSKEIFESKFDVKLYSDITKLFGVYIDNAIEAAKEAEIKEVEIDIKVDKDYLIITIGNTYSKNIDIDKIGKKGFSTKGKGHGFGLSLVKDITKSNEKIETITDITDNMFKQIILIDLK